MKTYPGFWLVQKARGGGYFWMRFEVGISIRRSGEKTVLCWKQNGCWCKTHVLGLYKDFEDFGYRPRPIINEAGISHTTHFVNMMSGQIFSVGTSLALNDLIADLLLIQISKDKA